MIDLVGRKVLIIGAGKSGIGSACLLERNGAIPVIYDSNENAIEADIRSKLESALGKESNAEIITGVFKNEMTEGVALTVLSPGVPTDIDFVMYIKSKNIPVWGEIELAYNFAKGKVVAITGTNGKTTTTSLVGQIMQEYYESVYIVGNIGNPYTDVAMDMNENTVSVAEISSFQLETIQKDRKSVV